MTELEADVHELPAFDEYQILPDAPTAITLVPSYVLKIKKKERCQLQSMEIVILQELT